MKIAGIVFVISGILAIMFPFVAGVALDMVYGIILAIAGATAFFQTWSSPAADHRTSHFLLALIFLAVGLLLCAAPIIGLAAFTLMIAIAFILQGLAQLAFVFGGRVAINRVWIIASGVLGLFAGVMILMQWPSSAVRVVGLLVGINLMLIGIALLTTRVDVQGHVA